MFWNVDRCEICADDDIAEAPHWLRPVRDPSSSPMHLSVSSSTSSCVPSARWRLGSLYPLASLVTQLVSSILLSVSRWDTLIGSNTSSVCVLEQHSGSLLSLIFVIVTPNQLTAAALVLQYWVSIASSYSSYD